MSRKIIIRDYSKIIFTYPTLIVSIIGWIIEASIHIPNVILDIVWSVVFFCNMFVVAFDFSPQKFIILFLVSAIGIVGFWYFLLPTLLDYYTNKGTVIALGFTSQFYIMMTGIFLFFFLVAIINSLFNYYSIERNELYHRIGIFARAERYAISNVSFDKEIPDIFEYFMLGAGSLTFYPEDGRRLVKLNTVIRINKKEQRLNYLLSKISVDDGKK